MGWDIDDIILNKVRGMLGERYAGCCYSMVSSYSPVIIAYRGLLTTEERQTIVALFPPEIRIEWQETTQTYNQTVVLHSRGFSAFDIFIHEKPEQHLQDMKQWREQNPTAEDA